METCLVATPSVGSNFLSVGDFHNSANSSGDGSAQILCSNSENALLILLSDPTLFSGSLTIRDCSAKACKMD